MGACRHAGHQGIRLNTEYLSAASVLWGTTWQCSTVSTPWETPPQSDCGADHFRVRGSAFFIRHLLCGLWVARVVFSFFCIWISAWISAFQETELSLHVNAPLARGANTANWHPSIRIWGFLYRFQHMSIISFSFCWDAARLLSRFRLLLRCP